LASKLSALPSRAWPMLKATSWTASLWRWRPERAPTRWAQAPACRRTRHGPKKKVRRGGRQAGHARACLGSSRVNVNGELLTCLPLRILQEKARASASLPPRVASKIGSPLRLWLGGKTPGPAFKASGLKLLLLHSRQPGVACQKHATFSSRGSHGTERAWGPGTS
jgi:hypothetical protein